MADNAENEDIIEIGPLRDPASRPQGRSWRRRIYPVMAAVSVTAIGIGIALLPALRAQSPPNRHHSPPFLGFRLQPVYTAKAKPSPTARVQPARKNSPQSSPSPTIQVPTTQVPTASPPGSGSPAPTSTGGRAPSSHKKRPDPKPSATHTAHSDTEVAYNKHGVPTFSDYQNASGAGPVIVFDEQVQVNCKIYAPTIPSASPGGYWYLIASAPWDGQYYAVANTFLNGDPPGGPYTHNYDPAVPDC